MITMVTGKDPTPPKDPKPSGADQPTEDDES